MRNQFINFISTVCHDNPMLESALIDGFRAVCEASDEAIVEDVTNGEAEDNTVTMDLDTVADNADAIQAILARKKALKKDSDAVDEQLVALANKKNG